MPSCSQIGARDRIPPASGFRRDGSRSIEGQFSSLLIVIGRIRFQKLYKLRELIQSICGLPVQVVHIEFGTIGHVVTPFPFNLLLLFSFKFDNVVQLAVQ